MNLQTEKKNPGLLICSVIFTGRSHDIWFSSTEEYSNKTDNWLKYSMCSITEIPNYNSTEMVKKIEMARAQSNVKVYL